MGSFIHGWHKIISGAALAVTLFACSGTIFALPCTPVFPCDSPFARLSLSGCKSKKRCGPQRCRQPFCMYENECKPKFCEVQRIERELNELRCEVEDGHMYSAVILGHRFLVGEGVCKDFNLAFYWYKRAAEAGIPVAQVQMGHFYRDGCQIPRDIKTAMTWYKRAVDKGDIPGMMALAELYRGWFGAKEDRAKALALYQKAAALGSSDAEYQGGVLLMMNGTQKNSVNQGIEKLIALAEDGHPDSMTALGDAYYQGRIGPRNIPKAYDYWFMAAKAGSALGAFKLGMAYFSGECATINTCEAAGWIIAAARRGLPEAELMAGDLYKEGRGVQKDLKEAADWYFKAADHHLWRAHLELADFYHAGKGDLPRFLEEAARRYMIASDYGNDAYASLMLSVMFEDGRGVPQDLCKNVEYFEKARCQPGFLKAQYKIGRRYAEGYALPRSMTLALRWYCRAAECGLPVAQVELGDIHYLGVCVPQDFGKAFEWYQRAACAGHTYAQNMLGLILLEGDCLPQYACTKPPCFQFKAKPSRCDELCRRCKQTICTCEPAYSERSGEGCPACLIPDCDKHLQVRCDCSPCTPCNCGARNKYRCVAWCQNICKPKYNFCGPIPGRCTVAISPENARRAAEWIHRAAINGAAQAQFQLGILYMKGIGVARDEGKAYAWLHTGMECVEDKNPDIINCLIDEMTPEMRRRAVCLAEQAKCRFRAPCPEYPVR
jgi:TPR repeat protein